MSLSVGIVGLPNAGKSTLFNALLKKQVADASNYPFCTIEPNKGVVAVPDKRLPVLAKIVKTDKIVPATVEFVDIAGLVKGAHEGEGLGNKFLSHIREVSVVVHVMRYFKDQNVAHVEKRIDPLGDVEIVQSELVLADLETLEKQKQPKGKLEKEEKIRWQTVEKLKKALNHGQMAKDISLSPEEKKIVNELFLLTIKPVIYVANVDESGLSKRDQIESKFSLGPVVVLSAKTESELMALEEVEQKEYLKELNLKQPGLNRLIKKAYKTLGLISFLTAGEKEARAWTIKKGITAVEAAGVIHTDFSKNFIKAQVVDYDDFVKHQGWQGAKLAGKVRLEGRDYEIKDGDVVEFKVGI